MNCLQPHDPMNKPKKSTIEVQGTAIAVLEQNDQDYISLTDIARYRNSQEPFAVINNWMRGRSTIEFLGLWEKLSNPDFKPLEFERFRNQAGSNYFVLSPQRWIEATQAIGITAKSGRYGGTFAQRDIAFEFASWISSEFKIYLIKEFQRLKDDENRRLSLNWNLNRTLSKLNYRIHTDAVKAHLQTAKQWRDANSELEGNMRDHASIEQLLVLANIEVMNAEFICMTLPQGDRLRRLNVIAIRQMQTLTVPAVLRRLEPPRRM